MQAELQCEQPNASLYTFTGNLLLTPPLTEAAQTVPLSPASILLRGSSLRNTKRVLGVVVFAGHETKASPCSVSITCPTPLCILVPKGVQQPSLCLEWCQVAADPYLDILCPGPTWLHSTRRQCRPILAPLCCCINPHCCHVAAAIKAQLLASSEIRYKGLIAQHSNLRAQHSLLCGMVVLTD